MALNIAEILVFILCGGLGARLKEMTEFRPKPMVRVGPDPILLHIMKHYSRFGFPRFVLCIGYKSEIISDYFLNFYSRNSDVTIELKINLVEVHGVDHSCNWKVTLAYTGELTMTGGRIGRAVARYLGDAEHYAVTYGDGLTDADLGAEFDYHLSHGQDRYRARGKPASRFGEFRTDGNELVEFVEKPELHSAWINGGYFFFHRSIDRYLSPAEDCVLEREPLSKLARDGQLAVFQHQHFWACMDTQRDHEYLTSLWESGKAPWARTSDR